MLEYARWKYILVAVVLAARAAVRAADGVWRGSGATARAQGSQPGRRRRPREVEGFLQEHAVTFDKSYLDGGRLMMRFPERGEQLKARDAINEQFNGTYITALSFAPRTPAFLRGLD